MTFEIKPCGDQSVTVQFEQKIDEHINDVVIELSKSLLGAGISECIPAYCALTVIYNPLTISYEQLCSRVQKCYENIKLENRTEKNIIEIPVHYGGAYGPDLAFVASHANITESEVVALHAEPLYRVFMIGFTPGFPYLGGLNPLLETPRLAKPRVAIEQGAVGIAGKQTGVYPLKSPGGWQLIGRTNKKLFDITGERPFLLKAGDYIRFIPIVEEDVKGDH